MRNFLSLLSISMLFIACSKDTKTNTDEQYRCTIQCVEQYVEPIFSGYADSMLDTVVYKLYAPNGKFDSFIKDVTYYDKATVESHYSLNSKYDYEVIVVGVDTFRISGFVNTPKSEEMWCGRHGPGVMHCFYYNERLIVDGDTVKPNTGEYVSKISLDKK